MNWALASSGRPAMLKDCLRHVLYAHSWLNFDRSIRLQDACGNLPRHLGGGIADVDLSARDVVLTTVKRCRLGQTGDCMLGRCVRRGVRPRGVGRYGAVIDDPATARMLALHEFDCFPRAKKGASEIDVDD